MASDSNQGNILITGATGNVGFEIVKQLLAPADRNTRLRAAVRSINDAVKVIGQRAELVEMDYSKPDSLSKAINGINKLFLLTPFEPNMVELSYNLISEAKKAGTVKHIVKQSVMSADAEPGIIPSRLHKQVEKIIEESGISCMQQKKCERIFLFTSRLTTSNASTHSLCQVLFRNSSVSHNPEP